MQAFHSVDVAGGWEHLAEQARNAKPKLSSKAACLLLVIGKAKCLQGQRQCHLTILLREV